MSKACRVKAACGSPGTGRRVVPFGAGQTAGIPPATRTMPFGSKVAVWRQRAVLRLLAKLQMIPLAGTLTLKSGSSPAAAFWPG